MDLLLKSIECPRKRIRLPNRENRRDPIFVPGQGLNAARKDKWDFSPSDFKGGNSEGKRTKKYRGESEFDLFMTYF